MKSTVSKKERIIQAENKSIILKKEKKTGNKSVTPKAD